MQQPNTKIYLILSGILIVLFLALILIPMTKKNTGDQSQNNSTYPTPTRVQAVNPTALPTIAITSFTGARDVTLPPEIADEATQKKNLRDKTPIQLSTFTVSFDYSQDKFTVSLVAPKDQSLKEFQNWKQTNYPAIPMDQFVY